jgi:hypothetical protein
VTVGERIVQTKASTNRALESGERKDGERKEEVCACLYLYVGELLCVGAGLRSWLVVMPTELTPTKGNRKAKKQAKDTKRPKHHKPRYGDVTHKPDP